MSTKEIDLEGLETLSVIEKANKFNKWMYETIKPYSKGRILEIGCGIGNISEFFINDNFDIVLSDLRDNYIEIVKNKVQSLNIKKYSVYKMIKERIKSDGYIKSMYRGLGPGIGSVFLRNGAAMIVMQYTQHYLTILGFRK